MTNHDQVAPQHHRLICLLKENYAGIVDIKPQNKTVQQYVNDLIEKALKHEQLLRALLAMQDEEQREEAG